MKEPTPFYSYGRHVISRKARARLVQGTVALGLMASAGAGMLRRRKANAVTPKRKPMTTTRHTYKGFTLTKGKNGWYSKKLGRKYFPTLKAIKEAVDIMIEKIAWQTARRRMR